MSIRLNSAFNLAGALIPLAVSLVTLPIYLGLIGEARYGVLAIVWILLGYFGLFDLGLGRAMAQRIAALRDAAADERALAFWTALALNLCLGVFGGLLIWIVSSFFFGSVVRMDPELRSEILEALPWLALALPMATLISVLSGTLHGRERFLELNAISVAGTVLFQLAPLASALLWGPDLNILLPAALLARLLTLVLLFQRGLRHVAVGQPAIAAWSEARKLLAFGGWVTVTSFVGPLMTALDRLLIGTLSGAAAVTYYTVPFQLAERTTLLSHALGGALFPRFSHAMPPERERLAIEALRTLIVIVTPLIAVGILVIHPFLGWWISPAFAESADGVGKVLLIGFWINSMAIIPFTLLQAKGRPDWVAKCHLGELLPYLLALYLGLLWFGILGAAIAFSIRVLADFYLLTWLAGCLRRILPALAFPALGLSVATLIAYSLPFGGSSWWFATVGLLAALGAMCLWQAPQALRHLAAFTIRSLRPPSLRPREP